MLKKFYLLGWGFELMIFISRLVVLCYVGKYGYSVNKI